MLDFKKEVTVQAFCAYMAMRGVCILAKKKMVGKPEKEQLLDFLELDEAKEDPEKLKEYLEKEKDMHDHYRILINTLLEAKDLTAEEAVLFKDFDYLESVVVKLKQLDNSFKSLMVEMDKKVEATSFDLFGKEASSLKNLLVSGIYAHDLEETFLRGEE